MADSVQTTHHLRNSNAASVALHVDSHRHCVSVICDVGMIWPSRAITHPALDVDGPDFIGPEILKDAFCVSSCSDYASSDTLPLSR